MNVDLNKTTIKGKFEIDEMGRVDTRLLDIEMEDRHGQSHQLVHHGINRGASIEFAGQCHRLLDAMTESASAMLERAIGDDGFVVIRGGELTASHYG